ncbi:g2/mitotic-specific cyclin cdc13 [Desarmillaria tabescens]|uniref:G2/mitotic-specific cyclin cdc13 n=1 Tax=Armillaria tabescens TaxID=1929756 RepID=A0AA39MLZ2_ARMTA|nr:g2/mitotic-specific cyclin cdc13 [Desarmillaria tabescens]KAK0438320.1 g2/mitotic-specific cyclin cdc13 [Desarmillaria tabescens]
MASNIPVRRPVRTVRAAVKDIENATARASRIATRSKTISVAGKDDGTVVAPPSKLKVTESTAEKAAVGKRKRGVLAEVSGPNGPKVTMTRGKEKETSKLDGSKVKPVLKPARQPLRTTVGSRVAPVASKETVARRKFTVASTDKEVVGHRRTISHSSTKGDEAATVASTSQPPDVIDEEDAPRVFKRRHTTPKGSPPPSPRIALPPVQVEAEVETRQSIPDESQVEAERVAAHLEDLAEDDEDWDDLDAEDDDDPLMVSEYVVEVCQYMKEVEAKTLPDPTYMDQQEELDWNKRAILHDWMLQVHTMYRCVPETFFLYVNIFDRFLSLRPMVSISRLQLVGISCFFVAAKFEESIAPSVEDIVRLAGEQYTVSEMLKAEQYVLKTLNWDLSYTGPMTWLRRGSKADDLEVTARTIANGVLVATPASLVAAASLWLARLALGREEWTLNLAHYSTFKENELLPTANILLNHLLRPEARQSATLVKKYSSKRFAKASLTMRRWVLSHWPEGSRVDLPAVLPLLKAAIRERRIAEAIQQAEEEEFNDSD